MLDHKSREAWLRAIRDHAQRDPELGEEIVQAVFYGMMRSRADGKNREFDLESAVSLLLGRRNNAINTLVVRILKRIAPRGFLEWGAEIAKLEGRIK